MPKKRSYTENEFRGAVQKSFSISGVLRELNLKPAGGNYKQCHKYISQYKIDTSHFTGQGWSLGKRIESKRGIPLSQVLVLHSSFGSNHLKNRLFNEGIFERICSRCKNVEWQEEKIPLELEHINGISTDNRLENLCLLCPNCHALTSTYRGKNISKNKG